MASPAPADPRWVLLLADVEDASANLAAGAELHAQELRESGTPLRLRRQQEKAFQKFLQDGYSSAERAMLRVLEIYDEPLPRGRTWHADLLRLATTPGPALTAGGGAAGRPPFAPALAAKLDRLRRFRHVAMHGYPNFDVEEAAPAAAAAARVAAALPVAAEAFGRAAGLLR